MARRPKNPAPEPDLPPQAVPSPILPPLVSASPVRNYEHDGTKMRVARFDLLQTEFAGVQESNLAEFHRSMSRMGQRGWTIVRRLFGIMPIIPKGDTSADDMRTWGREELRENMGMESKDLAAELDRMRGFWMGLNAKTAELPLPAPLAAELKFEADQLIEKYQMTKLLLREEVPWMAQRLDDWSILLDSPQVGEMARITLLTELELRRMTNELSEISKQKIEATTQEKTESLSDRYNALFKLIGQTRTNYQTQMESIDKINPFMKQVTGAVSMKGVWSDAVELHTRWMADPANVPVDGIFTIGEIQVLCRMSQQAPDPQYRASMALYAAAARAHLWDPKWSGAYAPRLHARIDKAWVAVFKEITGAEDEQLVDLTLDGPKGEYEPVTVPGKDGMDGTDGSHGNKV